MAPNWSGGTWRTESFLSQESDYEPPWWTMSSSSPVVMMRISTMPPRSSPGTPSLSLGNQRDTLLWGDPTMQLSPFQNQLLALAKSKCIQYIAQHFELFLPDVIFRCCSISCLVMKKMRFEWCLKIKLNTKHLKLIFYIETL